MPERRRSGFTLVEVLVASCVMVVLFAGSWQLFRTLRKMNDISTWQSARQVELRTGLQRLREDLMQACYPSVITRTTSYRVDEATHQLTYRDGGPFDLTDTSSDEFLRFYVCKPCRKTGLSGDSDGYVAECVLKAEGKALRYTRTHGQVPDAAAAGMDSSHPPDFDKVIIHDVGQFDVKCVSAASAEYAMQFCTITVTCIHPKPDLKTKVTEHTGAKVEVDAATF